MALRKDIIESAEPGINARGEATSKPYKLGDSGGLFLLIHPAKRWQVVALQVQIFRERKSVISRQLPAGFSGGSPKTEGCVTHLGVRRH